MRTVGNHKDSVSGLLQGINLDRVTGLYKALERAARTVVQKAYIPEASDVQTITLYDGVVDYSADENIFGGSVVDFRPQGESRTELDYVYSHPVSTFDRRKFLLPNGTSLAFEYSKGTPIVRIVSTKTTPRVNLDAMTETTGWTAAGTASGLTKDSTVYYKSPSSLRFNLAGSGAGTLTKAISKQSIASYEDVGVGFLAIRMPSADDLTSVSLKIGSDSSNYDEVTSTSGFLTAFKSNEWMLISFDMSGSTSTGTPDWSAIDYVQVTVNHTAAMTNFRVGGLWMSLPSPSELHYQTAAIFLRNSALSKTITDDDDQIVLSDDTYLLYEFESAVAVAEASSGGNRSEVADRYRAKLISELYPQYMSQHPDETIKNVGSYLE